MGIAPVKISCTYDCVRWEDDNEDPFTWGGYTDPCNPYSGLKSVVYSDDPEHPAVDADDPCPTVIEMTLQEAAEFVLDFANGVGGVWNWDDDAGEGYTDIFTGVNTTVMLHVDGDMEATVFELAQSMLDQQRRAALAREKRPELGR